MNAGPIPFELAIWVLGGLLTVIGALLIWIFTQINKKQDELAMKLDVKIDALHEKIDANEQQNHDDHRIVDSRLSRIESRLAVVEDRCEQLIKRNEEKDAE